MEKLVKYFLVCLAAVLVGNILMKIIDYKFDHLKQESTKPTVFSTQTLEKRQQQLDCLAKNIYYEAGSESIQGQAAVARVVMNRISHGFGNNPCAVVYQVNHIPTETHNGKVVKVKQCQFSWVCEGKGEPNKQSAKYKQAEQVAYEVLVNDAYQEVLPKHALYFHATYVDPMWPYKQIKRIGNHIFYSKYKKTSKDNGTKT